MALAHRWDVSAAEARQIQERLRDQVRVQPLAHAPRTVGGLDVHDERGAVAVLTWPGLEWIDGAVAQRPISFPYIPGLLSFREAPLLLAAIEQLGAVPDLLLCDGQGLAHPRGFGLACHIGLWLGQPTIGCAKTRLCGRHAEPGRERGLTVPLYEDSRVIGAVVRTRTAVKPVYVSVGHQITLAQAVEMVLRCTPRYRLPEPLRAAHTMAKTGTRPAVQHSR
jgi:deoxyribonuclease V